MNDANRESIMKMLSEGTLRPEEAAKLLAKLTEDEEAATKARAQTKANDEAREKAEKVRPATEKISIPTADGGERVVEVPSSLVPMITRMVGEAIKQHTKKVAKETVTGARNMVLNKRDEVVDTLKTAFKGGGKKSKTDVAPQITREEEPQFAARRQILQMVQNGRITARDASKLIQELDALKAYEKGQAAPVEPTAQPGNKKKR
jgi:hypothetical protein